LKLPNFVIKAMDGIEKEAAVVVRKSEPTINQQDTLFSFMVIIFYPN